MIIDLPVNIALGLLLRGRKGAAVGVMTFTATVLRFEIVLMLGPLVGLLMLRRRLTVKETLTCGAIGGFGGLGRLATDH